MNTKWIVYLLPILLILSCQEKKVSNRETSNPIKQETKTKIHIEEHPNGSVKIKGNLVKGIRQGNWISYYENGVKWSESEYLFGLRNGAYKIFYPNGKLKIHGAYKDEKKVGIWYFYNENGKYEKEIDFDEITTSETN